MDKNLKILIHHWLKLDSKGGPPPIFFSDESSQVTPVLQHIFGEADYLCAGAGGDFVRAGACFELESHWKIFEQNTERSKLKIGLRTILP